MILARCEIGPTCYPKRKRGITVRASVITLTARCKLSLNRMIIPAQASEWPRAGRTSRFSQIHDSPKAATCLITADLSPRTTVSEHRGDSGSRVRAITTGVVSYCSVIARLHTAGRGAKRVWACVTAHKLASHLVSAQYHTAVNLSPTQSAVKRIALQHLPDGCPILRS